jgi:hypothetical protein
MPVTVTFTPTLKEFREAQQAIVTRFHRCPRSLQVAQYVIIIAMSGAMTQGFIALFSNTILDRILAGILTIGFVLSYIVLTRTHQSNLIKSFYEGAIRDGPWTYTFEATVVRSTSAGVEGRLSWSAFVAARETSSLVILFLKSPASLFVPLRVLTAAERSHLEALIHEKLPVQEAERPQKVTA